jgi:hypothetical protein
MEGIPDPAFAPADMIKSYWQPDASGGAGTVKIHINSFSY